MVTTRYPQRAANRLIDEDPRLARELYDRMLCELTNAQTRMLLLGRMTACERVASFLIETSDRCKTQGTLDLPMGRNDIADYLGLTLETVCRELSAFRRDGIIAIPARSNCIEICDRKALKALSKACAVKHRIATRVPDPADESYHLSNRKSGAAVAPYESPGRTSSFESKGLRTLERSPTLVQESSSPARRPIRYLLREYTRDTTLQCSRLID